MKTVLCEKCFDGVAEEFCIRPFTPCAECGASFTDDNPTHMYVGDPRPFRPITIPIMDKIVPVLVVPRIPSLKAGAPAQENEK